MLKHITKVGQDLHSIVYGTTVGRPGPNTLTDKISSDQMNFKNFTTKHYFTH